MQKQRELGAHAIRHTTPLHSTHTQPHHTTPHHTTHTQHTTPHHTTPHHTHTTHTHTPHHNHITPHYTQSPKCHARFGNLVETAPGYGYKILVASGASTQFSTSRRKLERSSLLQPPPAEPLPHGWNLEFSNFEQTMTMTASVTIGGVQQRKGALAAFAGDAIRGVQGSSTTPWFGPYVNKPLFLLTIYGQADGEIVTFKFAKEGVATPLDSTLLFVSNGHQGSIHSPFALIGTLATSEITWPLRPTPYYTIPRIYHMPQHSTPCKTVPSYDAIPCHPPCPDCNILHRTAPPHTTSHRIAPHRTASHRIAPHRTASNLISPPLNTHCIAPHRSMSHAMPHRMTYHTTPPRPDQTQSTAQPDPTQHEFNPPRIQQHEFNTNLSLSRYYLPLTTYHLPLTTHHLPLTTYHLPLTTYHLPLTTYHSLMTHCS